VASSTGAHLVGLHVVDIPLVPGYVSAELPAEVFDIQHKRYMEAAEAAKKRFDDACAAAGVEGEWRCVEGRTQDVVEAHARYVDLLVMTGPDQEGGPMGGPSVAEDLLLTVGKPVLICPPSFKGGTVGEYVCIAWNGSREASRAVSDAMALLEAAKKVTVVVVRSDDTDATLGQMPGTDLGHFLARHGVDVEVQSIEPDSSSIEDALLEWSKAQGADLLVMGAYGHSRFREVLLGGATRGVLRRSHIPLLMSH
jgi:nucleotide-binding universal stress UspA family protein